MTVNYWNKECVNLFKNNLKPFEVWVIVKTNKKFYDNIRFNRFTDLKFDPGDEWPEGVRILRKLAKRDDNDRRRLKTKFVGDVEVVVKGNL